MRQAEEHSIWQTLKQMGVPTRRSKMRVLLSFSKAVYLRNVVRQIWQLQTFIPSLRLSFKHPLAKPNNFYTVVIWVIKMSIVKQ